MIYIPDIATKPEFYDLYFYLLIQIRSLSCLWFLVSSPHQKYNTTSWVAHGMRRTKIGDMKSCLPSHVFLFSASPSLIKLFSPRCVLLTCFISIIHTPSIVSRASVLSVAMHNHFENPVVSKGRHEVIPSPKRQSIIDK